MNKWEDVLYNIHIINYNSLDKTIREQENYCITLSILFTRIKD